MGSGASATTPQQRVNHNDQKNNIKEELRRKPSRDRDTAGSNAAHITSEGASMTNSPKVSRPSNIDNVYKLDADAKDSPSLKTIVNNGSKGYKDDYSDPSFTTQNQRIYQNNSSVWKEATVPKTENSTIQSIPEISTLLQNNNNTTINPPNYSLKDPQILSKMSMKDGGGGISTTATPNQRPIRSTPSSSSSTAITPNQFMTSGSIIGGSAPRGPPTRAPVPAGPSPTPPSISMSTSGRVNNMTPNQFMSIGSNAISSRSNTNNYNATQSTTQWATNQVVYAPTELPLNTPPSTLLTPSTSIMNTANNISQLLTRPGGGPNSVATGVTFPSIPVRNGTIGVGGPRTQPQPFRGVNNVINDGGKRLPNTVNNSSVDRSNRNSIVSVGEDDDMMYNFATDSDELRRIAKPNIVPSLNIITDAIQQIQQQEVLGISTRVNPSVGVYKTSGTPSSICPPGLKIDTGGGGMGGGGFMNTTGVGIGVGRGIGPGRIQPPSPAHIQQVMTNTPSHVGGGGVVSMNMNHTSMTSLLQSQPLNRGGSGVGGIGGIGGGSSQIQSQAQQPPIPLSGVGNSNGGSTVAILNDVIETKDVKRNKAKLPPNMTHAKPTTGDWLKKRYIVNNYILLDTLGTGSYGEVSIFK